MYLVVVTAMMAATLSTVGASAATQSVSPPSIANTPTQVAQTTLGNVQYRSLGSGPALVLIMGYAGTMQTWDPHFVDALARHFRVITFNNAGIGETTALAPLSIDAMADQTSALMTTLHVQTATVLGWSMGSMIAQALAIHHPQQVSRLILCATYPGNGKAVQPSQKDVNALTDGNAVGAQADLFPADQAMAAAAFDGGLSAYKASATTPASVIASQKSAILDWFDGRDATGHRDNQISIPTLVADGSQDRIDASSNDHDVASQIHGSRLVLYPDAGHAFLFQEGVSFTFFVRNFVFGVPVALTTSQLRDQYLADYKTVTAAGTTWVAGLKALSRSSTAQELARLDVHYADAQGAFDDELLGYGAKGALGTTIHSLVKANELVVRYVEAFGAQSNKQAKKWATSIKKDGELVLSDENALRHQLGLAPIIPPTTTTTSSTTTTIDTNY